MIADPAYRMAIGLVLQKLYGGDSVERRIGDRNARVARVVACFDKDARMRRLHRAVGAVAVERRLVNDEVAVQVVDDLKDRP